MQTFLPYPDFTQSAEVLDQKRLGKQRVETLQIFQAVTQLQAVTSTTAVGPRGGRQKVDLPPVEWTVVSRVIGWENHPATRMWRYNLHALYNYQLAICGEWTSRGYQDTCLAKTAFLYDYVTGDYSLSRYVGVGNPPWFGNEDVHASHRANLLRKDPEHYGQFGWTEAPVEGYFWPA